MKKLLCLTALAVAALIGVVAVAPSPVQAVEPAGAHREFVEFVVGPFDHEYRAHEEADGLRDRGYRAEIYFVPGRGWQVKAWRHE